jgi:hypothetical protein
MAHIVQVTRKLGRFRPSSTLCVAFHGATVTTDTGLLIPRELDEHPGLSVLLDQRLPDPRTGHNYQSPCRISFAIAVCRGARTSRTPSGLSKTRRFRCWPRGALRQILGRLERLAGPRPEPAFYPGRSRNEQEEGDAAPLSLHDTFGVTRLEGTGPHTGSPDLAEATGGSQDVVTGAAIDPYRKSQFRSWL